MRGLLPAASNAAPGPKSARLELYPNCLVQLWIVAMPLIQLCFSPLSLSRPRLDRPYAQHFQAQSNRGMSDCYTQLIIVQHTTW